MSINECIKLFNILFSNSGCRFKIAQKQILQNEVAFIRHLHSKMQRSKYRHKKESKNRHKPYM